ncbi:MAG: glycosyltransferase family 4 protein [Cyclobacteriaceae bacterium]
MKVAIVLNTSWNIYNFRMNFVKALIQRGYEVHTIAPVDKYTPFLIEAGCIHHKVRMDSRGANPIKDFALIVELWSIYRKLRPDMVLQYTVKPNVYGTIAATLLRIPVINNVCGLGTVFLKKNLVSAIAIMLYRLTFKFPKKVFFQNQDDLNLFVSKNLVNAEAVDLLPGSGVDLGHFQPVNFSRNSAFTFLLISRLITDKGILEYVEAVRKLKASGMNAKFQILGAKDPLHKRGIQPEVIEGWIKEGAVEYLGTTDDVREFISKADCIVLPSYREGTPRTLLEAASSSKPIIATDVPGCNNVVVDQQNGLLCKLKDSDDLAEKMKLMSSLDDEILKSFGEDGRKKMIDKFDEKVVIEKYFESLSAVDKA